MLNVVLPSKRRTRSESFALTAYTQSGPRQVAAMVAVKCLILVVGQPRKAAVMAMKHNVMRLGLVVIKAGAKCLLLVAAMVAHPHKAAATHNKVADALLAQVAMVVDDPVVATVANAHKAVDAQVAVMAADGLVVTHNKVVGGPVVAMVADDPVDAQAAVTAADGLVAGEVAHRAKNPYW